MVLLWCVVVLTRCYNVVSPQYMHFSGERARNEKTSHACACGEDSGVGTK